MNRSLKLAANTIGCLFLIAASPLASAGIAADSGDQCATKYSANDPVIARYEQAAKLKPLVPSKWQTVGSQGLNFNFESASRTNQDVVVRVTSIPESQKQALIAQLAGNSAGKITTYAATQTIEVLLASGFPFNAKLCARPDSSLYIELAGTGSATGKSGKIEVKPGANSIWVNGVIAGGQIDGSVQVQK